MRRTRTAVHIQYTSPAPMRVPNVEGDEIGRLPRHVMYPAFLALGAALWAGIAYGGYQLVQWL